MMKNYYYFKLSLFLTVSFWLFDSALHYFIYGEFHFELIPSDLNELWMRSIIIFLLVSFGLYADIHSKKIADIERDKNEVYISMLNANQHILNNFLQAMMLFRSAAEDSDEISEEILILYDKTIANTISQINNLHGIAEPSKKTIEERFLPKKNNQP